MSKARENEHSHTASEQEGGGRVPRERLGDGAAAKCALAVHQCPDLGILSTHTLLARYETHDVAARRVRYSSTPTRTGSASSVMPKVSCTWDRTSRARSMRSCAVALPRLVKAKVCLVDRLA